MDKSIEISARIARHADKGPAPFEEGILKSQLSTEDFNLVMTILKEKFPNVLSKGEAPLKTKGIVRSLELGSQLYEQLPEHCILLVTDSGKDRAELCRHLAVEKVISREKKGKAPVLPRELPQVAVDDEEAQAHLLEKHRERQLTEQSEKRVDILELQDAEWTELMEYSDPKSWAPYREKINRGELTASEANIKWIYDMNSSDVTTADREQIQGGAERYRKLIQAVHEKITDGRIGDREVPIILFAVGHNESLAQIKFEDQGGEINADQLAEFCEQYLFDKQGRLVGTKKVILGKS